MSFGVEIRQKMFSEIFVCSLRRFAIQSLHLKGFGYFKPEFKDEGFTEIFSAFSEGSGILVRILHEDFETTSDSLEIIFRSESHHRLDFFGKISSSEFKRCAIIHFYRINIFFPMCMILFNCILERLDKGLMRTRRITLILSFSCLKDRITRLGPPRNRLGSSSLIFTTGGTKS